MSLRELINIDVTSVSKKPRSLARSPAAVFVITAQDIRRSTATSVPELLRMVPGIEVARVDSSKWAITARGFNGRWANKLLVMIDGRTVYSPIFSGVYWDVQDVALEDIDRIEVIRGPGAAMWGANAVNGVISIVTRHSSETQGGLISATAGNQERGAGTVRYGGKVRPGLHYRATSRYFNRDRMDTTGGPGVDQWSVLRGGFRLDWEASRHDSVIFEGDLYQGRAGQFTRGLSFEPPYEVLFGDTARPSGGSLLARWNHQGRAGESQAQFFYDRTRRTDFFGRESVDTCDFDLQHRLPRLGRHDLQAGIDLRFTSATLDMKGAAPVRLDPFGHALVGLFVQDEISLVEDRLSLVLGSKFERNGYTGFEVQPAAQLLFTPTTAHTAWASVSRAVRLPSLVDRVARLDMAVIPTDGGLPLLLSGFGNPNLRSETLLSYEAGYRINPAPWFSADLAAYYNIYKRLRTTEVGMPFVENAPPLPPHLLMPLVASNQLRAGTYGLETAANWQPVPAWKLTTSYTWMGANLDPDPGSQDPQLERVRADSPRHQVQLRSYLDLPGNLSAGGAVSYTGALAAVSISRPRIPGYTRVDARLGWRPKVNLEFSAAVENLLDRRYTEFIEIWGTLAARSLTGRRAYAKITLTF